jgi:hypothetical protein
MRIEDNLARRVWISRSLKARASMPVLAVAFAAVALFVVLHGAQSNPAGSPEIGAPVLTIRSTDRPIG